MLEQVLTFSFRVAFCMLGSFVLPVHVRFWPSLLMVVNPSLNVAKSPLAYLKLKLYFVLCFIYNFLDDQIPPAFSFRRGVE